MQQRRKIKAEQVAETLDGLMVLLGWQGYLIRALQQQVATTGQAAPGGSGDGPARKTSRAGGTQSAARRATRKPGRRR